MNPTLHLHDIFGPQKIPDHSLLYFSLLSIMVLCLLFFLGYLLYRRYLRKERDRRPLYWQAIKQAPMAASHHFAYRFSYYGRLLAKPQQQESFEKLCKQLAPYKYAKEAPPLPDQLKAELQSFISALKPDNA